MHIGHKKVRNCIQICGEDASREKKGAENDWHDGEDKVRPKNGYGIRRKQG